MGLLRSFWYFDYLVCHLQIRQEKVMLEYILALTVINTLLLCIVIGFRDKI